MHKEHQSSETIFDYPGESKRACRNGGETPALGRASPLFLGEPILRGFGVTRESIYVIDDEKDMLALEARDMTEQAFAKQLQEWTEEWEKDPEQGIQEHVYF